MSEPRLDRPWLLAAMLGAVNAFAAVGTLGFGVTELRHPDLDPVTVGGWLVPVVFAVALQSNVLACSYWAETAIQRNESASGTRFFSTVLALLLAWVCYAHWSTMMPAAAAVALGLLSGSSPVVWRAYASSRGIRRPRL